MLIWQLWRPQQTAPVASYLSTLGNSNCRGTPVFDLQINNPTAGRSEGEPAQPHQHLPGLGAT